MDSSKFCEVPITVALRVKSQLAFPQMQNEQKKISMLINKFNKQTIAIL